MHMRLDKAGCYEAATTPILWRHKWRPIQFVLILDDFGIKYVGNYHALHLLKILEETYEITADWEGNIFEGIDLAWYYNEQHSKITCCMSINGHIDKLLIKYGYPRPSKARISPHKHREVIYGTKEQLTPE